MIRQPITLSLKCAAALLALKDEAGELLIPFEDSKMMTAAQVISLFQFDHYPLRVEAGGPTAPWNLFPRLIRAHRRKTARTDIPEIAKIRRIRDDEAEFRARLLAKSRSRKPKRSPWPKRSFPQQRRSK